MANPQPGNGHIDVSNEIADRLCSYRLNGQEWQIVWVVLRKTWGWLENPKDKKSPKKKMDRIALSQFAKFTGINRSRCHTLLKGLINKKILKRTVTEKYNTKQISYGFQKDYDLWRVLPKNTTVTEKCNGVLPKSVTKLLPKSITTKDTLKETITKERKKIYKRKFLEFVLLTDEEHEKLISQFGKTEALEWIERVNEYVGSKGKKYKSHYFTILSWARKDNKNDRYNI